MTISESLSLAIQKLNQYRITSASLDAEILLSFALKKPKEFLYSHPDRQLTSGQLQKFNHLVIRRAACEPIAYLTGHKEFYGLDFFVDKNVLIPRPETELMVEEVLNHFRVTPRSLPVTLIDIGTGSGCVPIALAKNLYDASGIKYYGLDISKPAITIAKRNAKSHGISQKIKFLQSDLLKNIPNSLLIIHNSRIVVTANLPYLTPTQYRANPDLKYEPQKALVAGPDGLKYYRTLLPQIKDLSRRVASITIFLEIDPSQTIAIKKVIHRYLPKAIISVEKDLSGHNRLVIIKLNYKQPKP
ncbi:MAG TPA: peptide chain release factor N(5)-glutamine methyltransferase [Patescibacteria group bacterium]|nr:peptide chain release factor N(5)-glutamine methyltransferase [Patescibacteria group bacterium]